MRINPEMKIETSSPGKPGVEGMAGKLSEDELREMNSLIDDMRRIAAIPSGANIAEVRNSFMVFAMFRALLLELNATDEKGNHVVLTREMVEAATGLKIEIVPKEGNYHISLTNKKGGSLDSLSSSQINHA